MMYAMRASAAGLGCALLLSMAARAEWTVTKWAGDGQSWQPDGVFRTISIYGPGTYKFSVTENGQPADLLGLIVAPNAGNVTVFLQTEAGGPGCMNLGATSYDPNTSTIVFGTVWAAGNAGTVDKITARRLEGGLYVDQDVQRSIEIYEIYEGRSIECASLAGLHVTQPESRANLTVGGPIVGAVDFPGDLDSLHVYGDILAPVSIGGSVGTVEIWAENEGGLPRRALLDAPLEIGGDIQRLAVSIDAHAPIHVGGSVSDGTLDLQVRESVVFGGDYTNTDEGADIVYLYGGATLEFAGDYHAAQIPVRWTFFSMSGSSHFRIGGTVTGYLQLYSVDYLSGLFEVGSIAGDLRMALEVTGQLRVNDDLAGTLAIAKFVSVGLVGLSGRLVVGNDLTGLVQIGDPNDLRALHGGITIYGDMRGGTIKVYGDMKPKDPNDPNSPSPYIRIDGGFGPDGAEPSMIDIDGAYEGARRFITIDFDGYDAADAWEANATITIGPDPNPGEYTENTPEARIFSTTPCKGDMLNDGLCDFGDIDALVAAFDPEAFGEAYPEFVGNRLYHGDLDCSSEVDFKDIDAFVARLGTCTPDCYQGDNMQGGGEGQQMQMMGGGAAVIAAQLAASVSAENMPALIVAIEQLALNPPANSTSDWSAVLAALAGI